MILKMETELRIKHIFLVVMAFLPLFSMAETQLRFASVFTDNMVLQQKSAVKIWGFAAPGENVELSCSWSKEKVKTTSDAQEHWEATLNTPAAGFTPQSLTVSGGGQAVALSNVLIGEVWLCSGQSNMEMILLSRPEYNLVVANSGEEIAKAGDFPYIRFMNIMRKESFTVPGEAGSYGWKVCTPNDVKWLSAVAWFFGKEIYTRLNVPVGLIVSSYGGSPVQSWIPEEIIQSKEYYRPERESRGRLLEASKQTEQEYLESMKKWVEDAEERSKIKTQPSAIGLPVNFEKAPQGNQMGEVLLSGTIDVPREKAGESLTASLGAMDDLGRVYFNGELVWEELRDSKSYSHVQFTIPAGKVKAGINTIEAKVLNILWGGGLTGPADEMYYSIGNDPAKIPLTGKWQFTKIFDLADAGPAPPEGKPQFSTASALFNGMIAPLARYTIKGCLWYQGEANVGDEKRYPGMMADLISSWRSAFKNEFPFYFVQIAPYNYDGNQKGKAALLREAQAEVEKQVPNTGMAVTIDLGDPGNIHPARKMEVGKRLATLALAECYGQNIPCKNPEISSAEVKHDTVWLHFFNVYKGLSAKGGCPGFEISGDGQNYSAAEARVLPDVVELVSPKVKKPRFVRYCWGDGDNGALLNSEGFPLSSFRLDVPYGK